MISVVVLFQLSGQLMDPVLDLVRFHGLESVGPSMSCQLKAGMPCGVLFSRICLAGHIGSGYIVVLCRN